MPRFHRLIRRSLVRTKPTGVAVAVLVAALGPFAHAAAAELTPGPALEMGATVAPAAPDNACVTGQSNDLNAQMGIAGEFEIQELCHNTPPGDPGDYKGFAFPLESCQTGAIETVAINFRIAEIGDPFYLYVWRDAAGLPNDACGLELYGAIDYVQDVGLYFSMYDLCDFGLPLADGERFWVGVVYRYIALVFGPDWYLGRESMSSLADMAYVNLSGRPGDWVDLYEHGFGNRFGIFVFISDDCGPVPVEASSWGALKALMR